MTGLRLVRGLKWARGCQWPAQIPHAKPRRGSAKAAGLKSERELAEVLPGAKHGLWWEFEDLLGHGWCQTDLLIEGGDAALVIEAKLSWVPEGQEKLSGLYIPVLEEALRKRIYGLVVVKRLVPGVKVPITRDLASAIAQVKLGLEVVWHSPGPVHHITSPRTNPRIKLVA